MIYILDEMVAQMANRQEHEVAISAQIASTKAVLALHPENGERERPSTVTLK